MKELDLQELVSSYKTLNTLMTHAVSTFEQVISSRKIAEALEEDKTGSVKRKVHLVKRIKEDFAQDLDILKGSFEEASEIIKKYGENDTLNSPISYIPLSKINFDKLLRLINFSQFEHIHGETFNSTFGSDMKYDVMESLSKFESMIHDLIKFIMIGKTITTKTRGVVEVSASPNKTRLLNFRDSNGETLYSNVIATLEGAEDFKFPKTGSEINTLIDLALDTNDVQWFNELLEEKKKVIDSVS